MRYWVQYTLSAAEEPTNEDSKPKAKSGAAPGWAQDSTTLIFMNYCESLNLSLDSLIGRNSVIAVAKLNTLEMAFNIVGNGSEGYEKPNQAQTVNTRNMIDNKYNEYSDILIKGYNVSSENVAISTINNDRKVRYRYRLEVQVQVISSF